MRDLMSSDLFSCLGKYCKDDVLDIGGWDFYETAIKKNIEYKTWTVLDSDKSHLPEPNQHGVSCVLGDGCNLEFKNNTFDTIVCIQVIEHVFEPIKLFKESARVLKKGGYGIFMAPQTGNLHGVPYHYQNFTKFWILEVCKNVDVELVEIIPAGGAWSTHASRLLHTVFQIFGHTSYTYKKKKRNFFFYLLSPFALVYIFVNLFVCLIFSLGDIDEEASNHIFVYKK
jgi:ubiquinone/menaquinone biosynthesis C-methylase UbiE